MQHNAITIRSLGKVYRLYRRPLDRALDAVGIRRWLPRRRRAFQEFWALKGIDLDVRCGERLGIVGSNGAGKSTLLKLITGNTSPTEGTIEVRGAIQALMQLGTGFHPEFTGRRNIRAALAYQGFSKRQIAEKEAEIIDFAELGRFIDQPVRTYSAGMYARLAFSAATSVEPEILIIDEVLGAGDAYFASKSADRMKRLTRRGGTTVLFVSHDMSSVEALCDRAIWLERGRLRTDGETHVVSKSYAQMVRQRSERCLRQKNALVNRLAMSSNTLGRPEHIPLVLRFIHVAGEPIEVRCLRIQGESVAASEIRVGDAQDCMGDDAFVLIDHECSIWGEPQTSRDAGHSRPIVTDADASSAVVFHVDTIASGDALQATVQWRAAAGSTARLEVYDGSQYRPLAELRQRARTTTSEWKTWTGSISQEVVKGLLRAFDVATQTAAADGMAAEKRPSIGSKDSLGGIGEAADDEQPEPSPTATSTHANTKAEISSGQIQIERVWFADAKGHETCMATSLEPLDICVDYAAHCGPLPVEFAITVYREGVTALQALSGLNARSKRTVDAGERGRCTLRIPKLPLGRGRYFVTVAIFPPLNYNSLDNEPNAYVLHDRRYEIEVLQDEDILIDLGMCRADVSWDVVCRAA